MRFGTRKDHAFTFGNIDEGSQINNGIYTIWDTGSSDIMLSILWYESFVEQLYGVMGIEYEIQDGVSRAACATNYPDLWFMHNGYWMQVKPKDYIREESASVCSLKIKPIDAPFNIMGMPAYIGYYIQHNWGESSYMTFAPHTDSTNAVLEESTAFPTKELRIKYESENTPNGDVWAFAIAFFIALCSVGFWGYVVYVLWAEGATYSSDAEAVGWAAGGFFAIFIGFFILRFILLLFLMPGNNIQEVPTEDEAIQRVNATHMSMLGYLSFFFYKLCGLKKRAQKKTAEKRTSKAEETAEIDELINSIE